MIIIYSVVGLLGLIAIYDLIQRKHTIKSNFPIVGHLRYMLEKIGPELRQYWVANNREEGPFNRVERAYIYASAKGENNMTGFGSDANFDLTGHFFIRNSAFPTNPDKLDHTHKLPKKIIGANRKRPYYPQSLVNISAMSYGSLGHKATEANNIGAEISGAYQNIGEGGFSNKYHNHGDVVFQIGTGYFGCGYTDEKGNRKFNVGLLNTKVASNQNIRMIEVKLSQGAKAGKGGILPGKKITPEIAYIRGVEMGKDVNSPAYHSAFSTAQELVDFCEMVAETTGLPVGIKSAVGQERFWLDLARIMSQTGKGPDFITIDGGEGGTGAAPAAFADNMSLPFDDAFTFVYNTFRVAKLTDRITFIASGKLGHPSKAVKAFAMGADLINIAREVMMSAGCIQAQSCHTGNCPAGIATHKWWLQRGFDVKDKSERVGRFIKTLNKDIFQMTYASGYTHPSEFDMDDVLMNTSDINQRVSLEKIYGYRKRQIHR